MIDELKALALQLAPELSRQPLYVVDLGKAGLPRAGGNGFAIQRLPSNVFDVDDWQGPGALVALDVDTITRAAKRGCEESCLKAVLIHELAHILPVWDDDLNQQFDAANRQGPEEIRESLEREMTVPASDVASVVWRHGAAWIRRCVHLWARAVAAGHEVHANDITGYDWLTKLDLQLSPLMGDAITMMGATFAEIDARPIPEHTQILHYQDAERYKKTIAPKEDAA